MQQFAVAAGGSRQRHRDSAHLVHATSVPASKVAAAASLDDLQASHDYSLLQRRQNMRRHPQQLVLLALLREDLNMATSHAPCRATLRLLRADAVQDRHISRKQMCTAPTKDLHHTSLGVLHAAFMPHKHSIDKQLSQTLCRASAPDLL